MCCSPRHADPQRNVDGDELLVRLQQMSLPSFLFFRADDLSERRSASLCQVLLQIETELIGSGSLSVVADWNEFTVSCKPQRIKTIAPPLYSLLLPLTPQKLLRELVRMCLPFLRPDSLRSRKACPNLATLQSLHGV